MICHQLRTPGPDNATSSMAVMMMLRLGTQIQKHPGHTWTVSQWEREAIGERTRDALRHKRSTGERVGNIRFGFRLSPDGKHVEPDPGEQGVLTEIRHLRQSGHTLRGIAVALNRQSLRTRRGSAWRLEHVARIIKQATNLR